MPRWSDFLVLRPGVCSLVKEFRRTRKMLWNITRRWELFFWFRSVFIREQISRITAFLFTNMHERHFFQNCIHDNLVTSRALTKLLLWEFGRQVCLIFFTLRRAARACSIAISSLSMPYVTSGLEAGNRAIIIAAWLLCSNSVKLCDCNAVGFCCKLSCFLSPSTYRHNK